MVEGRILKVSGPLVIAEGMREANMFDVVRVGDAQLIGEIIEIKADSVSRTLVAKIKLSADLTSLAKVMVLTGIKEN